MMSGASSYEVIEHARRRAVEFLAKPFAPMELLETVRSLLDDDSRNIPPQPGQQHPPVETVLSHARTQAKSQAQGGNDMNHAKEFLKSIGSFVLGRFVGCPFYLSRTFPAWLGLGFRQGFEQRGQMIPVNDIWIAAIARETKLPILARDEHFSRVQGLSVIQF